MTVRCPYCSVPATLVNGTVIYPHRRDLASKRFWSCEPCGAYVGCHPGTENPLGRLANAELRAAKIEAHGAFDPMWMLNGLTRKQAYNELANRLGIHVSKCHIGEFDLETCRRVVEVCR